MEALIPRTKLEVDGICKILKKQGRANTIRILDVSCGIGRHSIELAMRGFDVVGYDPSEFLISYAQNWLNRLKNKSNLKLRFVHGRPLNLSKVMLHQKFDAPIIMGNSLGLVDENFDILLLRDISKVVESGSILIMEVENRDWTLKNFQPNKFSQAKNIELHEAWEFDPKTSSFDGSANFYKRVQEFEPRFRLALALKMRVRVYSLREMTRMLRSPGWTYKGNFESIQNILSL